MYIVLVLGIYYISIQPYINIIPRAFTLLYAQRTHHHNNIIYNRRSRPFTAYLHILLFYIHHTYMGTETDVSPSQCI